MRQIGDDFKRDPFQAIQVTPIGEAKLSAQEEGELQQWRRNTFMRYAFNHCSDASGINASKGSSVSEECQQAFNACVNKYRQSLSLFSEEKRIYDARLQEIKSAGGDMFAKFNQY